MPGKATVLLATFVCLLLPLRSLSQTQPTITPVMPKIYRGDGWSIAAPGNWESLADLSPPIVLHLVGDDCEGVPVMDGSLSPVKVGLQIQRIPNPEISLKDAIASDLKELKDSGSIQVASAPDVREIALRDGNKASLLKAEFISNGRFSIQQKLYVDAGQRHIVVTAFITCSKSGVGFVKAMKLPEFLEAHVTSLVLAPDLQRLKDVYQKHDWKAGEAIALVREGNRMLEAGRNTDALSEFREASKVCPYLPAAHNGLAFALLQTKDVPPQDLREALEAAKKAVQLTDELDFATLDTLSLAYFRSGQKEQAVKTIKQALTLKPDHPDLLARLKSFETGN
jgi:tetratricopeptide (TPR) repeat protein